MEQYPFLEYARPQKQYHYHEVMLSISSTSDTGKTPRCSYIGSKKSYDSIFLWTNIILQPMQGFKNM
jgi:hypothetical protein